ncbi:hypothetical protein [Rhizobium sp.]|uniref:hypothetical protein n=1 Tax=Rhizobium sp. TaxID=391 RepID=UPI0028AC17AA
MSDSKPPLDAHLAMCTADVMAMPQMVCRRHSCRRGQRCRWYFETSREPCCLRNLDPGQRAIFDQIYQAAHFAKGFLGSDGPFFEALSGPERLSDDLSIAIARNVAHRWMVERWDKARRAREKRIAAADRLRDAEE